MSSVCCAACKAPSGPAANAPANPSKVPAPTTPRIKGTSASTASSRPKAMFLASCSCAPCNASGPASFAAATAPLANTPRFATFSATSLVNVLANKGSKPALEA